jgi:hypothetical protein
MLQRLTLLLAAASICAGAAATEYLVVVPVKGRTEAHPVAPDTPAISVSLSAGSLPAATVTSAYHYDLKDFLRVTGDAALDLTQAQWSVVSPLPSGLTLSSAGHLAGSPSATGQINIQANVSYKNNQASQIYTLAVKRLEYLLDFEKGWTSSAGTGASTESTLSLNGAVMHDGAVSLLSTPADITAAGRAEFPAAPSMQFGTGDFTFEAWGYRTGTNGSSSGGIATLVGDTPLELLVDDVFIAGGGVAAFPGFSIAGVSYGTTAVTVPLNQWMKYSLVRRSGQLRFYVNDTQVPIATYSPSAPNNYLDGPVSELPMTAAVYPTGLWVANRGAYTRQWLGYIDSVRISLD